MSKLLEKLNPAQREAVTHESGPLLIIAGPGSGKTETVVRSIAYAIENGEQPDKILAFSFTGKACAELRERVTEQLADEERGSRVQIFTFHSFCRKVLKEDLGQLYKTEVPNFQDLDEDQQEKADQNIVAEAINYLQYQSIKPETVYNFIVKWKVRGIRPSEIKNYTVDPKYADIYGKYEQRLKEDGWIDYPNQLLFTDELLTKVPEVKKKWQGKFDLIFVDEYQDTEPVQYRIIKSLVDKRQNLRVVGDDDQGIYGFRGADIQNILKFEQDYPKAKDNVILLGQNYRSTQRIVETSRALAEFNPERREKELFTRNFEGEKVKYLHCENDEEEASNIATFIQHAVDEGGRSPSDFAVLYRNNKQANTFKTFFDNCKILSGVPMMTIHKSKGLEFPNVFVVGVCKNLLPNYHNRHEKDWDEELRLLYVAMTRAKNWLCLSSYERDDQYSRGPSPFLGYIPSHLLKSVDTLENVGIPPCPKEMEVLRDSEGATEYVEQLPEELLGDGMTVLGVDPGIQNVGWAITRKSSAGYTTKHCTQTTRGWQDTLVQTKNKIKELISSHPPYAIAVENIQIGKEATRADWFVYVAGCVATIKSIAHQHGIKCQLYTPQQVKYTATNNRGASKQEVQEGVMRICSNLQEIPEPHHSADAIAASLCYLRSYLNSARYEGDKERQKRYQVGCDYLDKGQYEAAVNEFEEAVNVDPIYTEAHCDLARAYLGLGKLEEAENSVKEALRLDHNYQQACALLENVKQEYCTQGYVYIERNEYANAINLFLKASDIDPDDKEVWTNLGRAYYWIDDYKNATRCYQKSADIDPNDKTVYTNLGNAYYRMGAYVKAIDRFQKARNIDENCAKTCYYLARVHFKLGNWEEAELIIDQALRIAPTYQDAIELSDDIKMATDLKMIRIPTGEFLMGSNDKEAKDDEQPTHTVYVDEFYIDIHPVTNAQYKAFIDANPKWQKDYSSRSDYLKHWDRNNYPQGKDNHPVTYVNWYAAMAYAQWTGKRLPTEAEWEKAAREGGTEQTYQSGDFMNASKANYNHAVAGTISVRTYLPNNYGLYDMTDNVREWCLDEYNSDFYKNSPRRNPMAGSNNIDETINSFKNLRTSRVLRGNSWRFIKQSVQVTRRFDYPPMYEADDIGFRCAKSVTG